MERASESQKTTFYQRENLSVQCEIAVYLMNAHTKPTMFYMVKNSESALEQSTS